MGIEQQHGLLLKEVRKWTMNQQHCFWVNNLKSRLNFYLLLKNANKLKAN